MTPAQIELLWRNRKIIFPTASEDEISHAFTAVLESPPANGEKLVSALRERGVQWRKQRAHVNANELLAPNPGAMLDEPEAYADFRQDQPGYYHPLTIQDVEFAEVVNDTIRAVGPDSQAFILTEVRGLDVEEAAGILGLSVNDTEILAGGVVGFLRDQLKEEESTEN